MRILIQILTVSFVSFSYAADKVSNTPSDPTPVIPTAGLVPENLILISDSDSSPKHIFIADKEKRTLTIWSHDKEKIVLVSAYAMDIGKLQGDKVLEGDHRTPEGIYFFQTRKDGNELNFSEYGKRAFTLDYPNYFDRLAKKTGSGIWLHAVPDTTSLMRGSRGCVVVRNEVIDKITPLIVLKSTPLLILDKVSYVKPEVVVARRNHLQNWVEKWKTSWESKNIDDYMSHYGDQFLSQTRGQGGMTKNPLNKNQWRAYKKYLSDRNKSIRIAVKDPFLLQKRDEAIISFIQDYQSDGLKDLGEKTLYVKKKGDDNYEIVTEVWQPLKSGSLAAAAATSTSN
jgi:murein L,D-transpeptidase YafK